MDIRISDIKLVVVEQDVPVGKYASHERGFGGKQELVLVRVLTDKNIEGNCFAGSYARGGSKWAIDSIISVLKPEFLGQNALDREKIWHRMWLLRRRKSISMFAIGALDVALWDIAGKIADLPIHQLLGTYKNNVKACASSMYWPNPEQYVTEALEFKEKGFLALKLFPGGTPQRDIEICRSVREAVGDKMELIIDAVFSYNRSQALYVGKALEELNFLWFEDPLVETDIQGYVELSHALDIPVAAADAEGINLSTLPEYILRGALDIIRTDAALKGGITPVKKMADLCECFGLRCEVHHGGNALMNIANFHVILSIKGGDYYEMMIPISLHEYGLTEYVKVDDNGYVYAPNNPGLGFKIDWDRINHDKVTEL